MHGSTVRQIADKVATSGFCKHVAFRNQLVIGCLNGNTPYPKMSSTGAFGGQPIASAKNFRDNIIANLLIEKLVETQASSIIKVVIKHLTAFEAYHLVLLFF